MSAPHSPRPAVPRIAPMTPDEMDERQAELVGAVGAIGSAVNIFTTLVRHPGLFARWLPFGGKLLLGKLPARDRELLILRTGYLCGAEYEWAQHVTIARQAGLHDDEIERVALGSAGGGWSPLEAALLDAADELHRDSCIADDTWSALAERYDDQQMIEVTMVVGHYTLLSFTLNSLGVQPEDGTEPLPSGEAPGG